MKKGFTLIEVLVAAVVFLIATLGILPLMISNIKTNEAVQEMMTAKKVLEGTASELRGINTSHFTKGNLKTIGFQENPPSGYPSLPSTNCPSGYEYAMYKGKEVDKIITGIHHKYKFTIKMCVDDDYLKPYLKKVKLWVYWSYRGKRHKLSTEVFITAEE